MGAEVLTQPARDDQRAASSALRRWLLAAKWLLAIIAGGLYIYAATLVTQDVDDYHCYALAFWRGARAVASLNAAGMCLTPVTSFSTLPFHTLPAEYGPLALLTFLPPLLAPAAWYDMAFFAEMTLVALAIAWLLDRYGARGAGLVWLVYALLGCWTLTAGRFDVAPAACVVVAIIAARRGALRWAYVALALGTLMKLYPLALLPLLLIESWRARAREPLWRGPALFAAIIVVVEGLAALVAPAAVLGPLGFMGARCVQIESLPATFGALWAHALHAEPQFPYAFNSTCELTPGMGAAQGIALALGLIGIALTLALYWRRRVTLGLAALLIVGSLIVGSKVFSPQYLLWLSPLVALEYGAEALPLLAWGFVCLLTTLCFPYSYNGTLGDTFEQSPLTMIMLTAGARNLLLLALGGLVLVWRALRRARPARQSPATSVRLAAGSHPIGDAP